MSKKRVRSFEPETLLSPVSSEIKLEDYRPDENIFMQGHRARALYYVVKGKVKFAVRSDRGKSAVLAIFSQGEFFGVGCMANAHLYKATASAITACSLIAFEKQAMPGLLQARPEFSELFVKGLVARVVRYEEELVDCLFNSSEKRLARILLAMAHFGRKSETGHVIPKLSQQTLCEMVGTTRSRVSLFMNKFRKLGMVTYNGELKVHKSLHSVLLDARQTKR